MQITITSYACRDPDDVGHNTMWPRDAYEAIQFSVGDIGIHTFELRLDGTKINGENNT